MLRFAEEFLVLVLDEGRGEFAPSCPPLARPGARRVGRTMSLAIDGPEASDEPPAAARQPKEIPIVPGLPPLGNGLAMRRGLGGGRGSGRAGIHRSALSKTQYR